ncbi:unnamed protein product [Nyctereutes procyonoides]|uniref:Ribosomal protein L15 n=1 Tax=Nyctereutes procyonoides TaxID=34880 RepID=A0A811ZNG0_NYCPR|nr:unnamed protein product [Nyctereutes procyonoides]
MGFLLRVHCWQYSQLSELHRAPHPTWPHKARRLGYKAQQGYVIYQIHVRHGGHEHPVPRWSLPIAFSLLQRREMDATHCGALRVLNSCWVGKDSTYKFFEVILIDPIHKPIKEILTPKLWPLKGSQVPPTIGGSHCAPWKKCNTLQLHRYC